MNDDKQLKIGDAVGVDDGFAWIVTRLPFSGSPKYEVTTPSGHRQWVSRDRITFVERTKQLDDVS